MKKALCFQAKEFYDKIGNFTEETFNLEMVDREICENPDNNYIQVIPYVIFQYVNVETGVISFLMYDRADSINENRLKSLSSIGFGGHIDNEEEIEYTVKEDDKYVLTAEQLLRTIKNAADREIKEELNVDLSNYDSYFRGFSVYMGDQSVPVNKVHVAFVLQYVIPEEEIKKLKESDFNKEEIKELSFLTINLRNIFEDGLILNLRDNLYSILNKEYNLEPWSLDSVINITNYYFYNLFINSSYDGFVLSVAQNLENKEEAQVEEVSS